MNWFFPLFLGIGIALISTSWGLRQKEKFKKIKLKYSSAISIDKYVEEEKNNIDNYVEQEKKELELFISDEKDYLEKEKDEYNNTFKKLEKSIKRLEEKGNYLKREHESMLEKIELISDEANLIDYGFYKDKYNFEVNWHWDREIRGNRLKQTTLINRIKPYDDNHGNRNNNIDTTAAYPTTNIIWENSVEKGRLVQLGLIKLMLRAFNGECDALISKVTWKNINLQTKRINASYEAINKIGGKTFFCIISQKYKLLKIRELELAHEFEEWKQKEKEEQRRIKEIMRDEEKAKREIEKAKRDQEKEEKQYREALDNARNEVAGANERQKEKLLKQIAELEERMKEMEEKKRSISQAEITKTGHVYIISNIGSFGDDMFKIGMTRRLEPLDRVKELGDASVPFPFDIHAMIRTTDAPSLEKALHNHFDQKRVNLENNRKEFFYVSIEEIKEQLKILKTELGIESEFQLTMLAEAKQYRQSESKRIHLQKMYENS